MTTLAKNLDSVQKDTKEKKTKDFQKRRRGFPKDERRGTV